MRYVRLTFFISFIIGVSKVFAADMLSASSDTNAARDLPEHFSREIPWRCPENIKLEYDLRELTLGLEEAEKEGNAERIAEYNRSIIWVKKAIAKWERDSYDLEKKQKIYSHRACALKIEKG